MAESMDRPVSRVSKTTDRQKVSPSDITWAESSMEEAVLLLEEAVRLGKKDDVLEILRSNLDCLEDLFDPFKNSGHFILHNACRRGYEDIATLLLNYGCSMYTMSFEGTALGLACQYGHYRVVETLLTYYDKSKLPVLDDAPNEFSPFYLATYHGHASCLQLLFKALDVNKNEVEDYIKSFLLYTACCGGHLATVQFWMSNDVDINHPAQMVPATEDNVTHMTPLFGACSEQRLDVIEYLICNGAFVKDNLVKKFPHLLSSVLARFVRTMHDTSEDGKDVSTAHFLSWGRKGLHMLPDPWFKTYQEHLTVLDLSFNKIKTLSSCVPWSFPNITDLNISHCGLKKWTEPPDDLQCVRLKDVDASHNLLEILPSKLFQVKSLEKLNLSHNKLQSLCTGMQDDWAYASATGKFYVPTQGSTSVPWDCPKLKVFDVSNNQLTQLPIQLNVADKLEKLYAMKNQLKFIPAWECPLDYLELSHNKLNQIPGGLELFWSNTLKTLHLAYNQIEEISQSICKLGSLRELVLAHNKLKTLPKVEWWDTAYLERLDLSYNELRNKSGQVEEDSRVRKKLENKVKEAFRRFGSQPATVAPPTSEGHLDSCGVEFPHILRECLDELDLGYNKLRVVPPSVCQLKALRRLNLSGNKIHQLPYELGKLEKCYSLGVEGLQIDNLPTQVKSTREKERNDKDILIYLKSQLRQCEPYNRIKLVVVGQERVGKTTLLSALRGLPECERWSLGVDIQEWKLTATDVKKKRSKELPDVVFSTWDLAGGQEYQVTHQCFLSQNALYLVVYDLSQRERENNGLRDWLKNIQARAPGSLVIVVGTQLDRLGKHALDDEDLKATIASDVYAKYPNMKAGNPKIVRAMSVTALKKMNGIAELREVIYNTAIKMTDSGFKGQTLVGRKVPKSYLELECLINVEAKRRQMENNVPVILADDFEDLAYRNSIIANDFDSPEELELAAQFLHESGVLLHFADQLGALNTLYIIEPLWLCEMLSKVISVTHHKHVVKNGILPYEYTKTLFSDKKFPLNHLDQYIQLMERFDIAYLLNKKEGKSLLIPSRLPEERPGILSHSESDVEGRMMRLYKMAYVPTGFWSRLITRLLVSIKRDEVIPLTFKERGKRSLGRTDSLRYSKERRSSRFRFRLRDKDTVYWREGIKIDHATGYVLVESAEKASTPDHKITGVLITVQSNTKDFSVIGSVVDQIEALINEWFPGLDDLNITGEPVTQRIIPCPLCIRAKVKDSSDLSFLHPDSVIEVTRFTVDDCALQALKSDTINCHHHPDTSICLKDIIPDLLLADLPAASFLDEDRLEFDPSTDNILGRGGEAYVYCGRYDGKEVAIKQFHSAVNQSPYGTGSSDPESTQMASFDTEESFYDVLRKADDKKYSTSVGALAGSYSFDLEEHLMASKVIRSFKEVRQEVGLLSRLRHPCIVSLIGASIYPRLCFALELAPLGNLQEILREIVKGRGEFNKYRDREKIFDTVLDRDLTYKIALQVASALKYLHAHDVIYRDLKSDNILVWNLDLNCIINVKVSDYGISRFSTPQGVTGSEGTPGFQAPEVRPGMAYDEQVDIFSYAMVLYELFSGQRPYSGLTQTSIITVAVRKGSRPRVSEFNIDTKLPCVENLMLDCWKPNPAERPTAEYMVKFLRKTQVLCQLRILPGIEQTEIGLVDCISSSKEKDNHLVMVWEGYGDERKFSILDVEHGNFKAIRHKSCGPRPTCCTRVGADNPRVWVGTKGKEIEVFGFKFHGQPDCLWRIKTKGVPLTSVFKKDNQVSGRRSEFVYIALDDGRLTVMKREFNPPSTEVSFKRLHWTYSSTTNAKEEEKQWKELKTIVVASREQSNMPAQALCLVNDERELWVGCGSSIAILDTGALLVEERIQVYSILLRRPQTVRQLVCREDKVWCINKTGCEIVEIDAPSRRIVYKLDCSLMNPVNKVISTSVRNYADQTEVPQEGKTPASDPSSVSQEDNRPMDNSDEPPPLPPKTIRRSKNRSVVLMDNEFRSDTSDTKMSRTPSEELEKACGLSELSRNDPNQRSKTLPQPTQRISDARLAFRNKPRSASDLKPEPRERLQNISASAPIIVHSILVVGDTLWVARSLGDVLIVNITEGSPHEFVYGQVISALSSDNERGYKGGNVKHLAMCGSNYVVSARSFHSISPTERLDEKGQLTVWKPFDTEQVHRFNSMWKQEFDKE